VDGTVLVAGASGFVGQAVAERAKARGLQVATTTGDLRDSAVIREAITQEAPVAVLQLAAPRHDNGAEPLVALEHELAINANVVRAVRGLAPDAAVLIAGSSSQYGLAGPDRLQESTPMVPVQPSGAIKCVLEQACLSEPLRGDVRVIWARCFNFVGPRQPTHAPVASWARQVALAERRGGGVLETGRLDVVRDIFHVHDGADALLDLVATDFAGPINVASGAGVRLRDVAEWLVAAADVKIDIRLSDRLVRAVDPPMVVADTSLLRSTIDWRPQVPLPDAVVRVLDHWRKIVAAEDEENAVAGSGRG
jgi:nucleoside-diphosphate-sugar epimerase